VPAYICNVLKSVVFAALLSLCLKGYAQSDPVPESGGGLYSINADEVLVDATGNTTTYKGNARVVVANLVIEADSISITTRDGLPSRVAAAGSPVRFSEQVPKKNINGTAKEIVFDVSELRLTLVDYSIADPAGNNMKGKKASFVLSP